LAAALDSPRSGAPALWCASRVGLCALCGGEELKATGPSPRMS